MTGLLQQVRRTIRRHDLCPPGTRVVVALSGGSDSVALTLILRELAEHGLSRRSLAEAERRRAKAEEFTITKLAHLNHRLRASATRDEQFCRDFANRVGLPIVIDSVDVRTYASEQRLSIEEAARRVRYAFLHRAAADANADRIALGHTRDDQAETFLLKLVRGAGLTGLGGIYPRNGLLIRPLLEASRDDLRQYLVSIDQAWIEDESNEELSNPRNRIRHKVLPELDRAYGSAALAIARAAALAREDGQWLDEVADGRYKELAVKTPEGVEFDANRLQLEPLPLRRRVLLQGLRTVAPGREVGLDHVEAVLSVLSADCAAAEAPGSRAELRRGKLVLIEQSIKESR